MVDRLTPDTVRSEFEKAAAGIPPYPSGRFSGRGIVICGGGPVYFPSVWVCINLLRSVGCKLPVQLWHLGPSEMNAHLRRILAPLDVQCIDALEVRRYVPARILRGWEIKPYAILNSSFKEVLFLDADNTAVRDPEYLFTSPQFRETGALFWPDIGRLAQRDPIWGYCGIPYRDEPEFESGQIVVDKERCWQALVLTMWMNEYSDFFYQRIYGDKDTFHLAFRKLGKLWSMPEHGVRAAESVFFQHDFEGRPLFQHRNHDKWRLGPQNKTIPDFEHEAECKQALESLLKKLFSES